MAALDLDTQAIEAFCRRHHICKLALFGSVVRDDFTAESDVDVLVEFEEGHTPGLAFFGMEIELGQLIGRKVDLNTPDCLPRILPRILPELEVVHERT